MRDLYIEAVIPGLVANGMTPAEVAKGNTEFAIAVGCLLTRHMPAAQSHEAMRHLINFYGEYVLELMNSAYKASRHAE